MKHFTFWKSLFLLFALIVGTSTSWADTVTFDYADYKGEGTSSSGSQYTMVKDAVSIGDTKFYGNNSQAHFYANGVTTITPAANVKITQIVLTATGSGYNGYQSNGTVTPSIGSMSHSDATVTWTGAATSAFTISHNKQIRWTSIVVTYEAVSSFTITAQSNNTDWGTVSGTTTITAAPKTGYRVSTTTPYTITNGTATVVNNGDNTFSVTPTSNCTVRINFEAIPTYTLSSAVNPAAGGTVALGATSVLEGANTTATATANAGYKFKNWSVSGTGATLSSTTDNPTTVTMGTADATVTATFETATTYAISWSVNGTVVQTNNVEENTAITFPTSITGIPAGYILKGWVTETNKISGTQATAPTYVTEATSTENITYYAVMAVEVGVPASLTKLTKDDDIADGDKIVFVAVVDETTAYGMYQQTHSSSYVANFNFTESVSAIAADSKKWFTMEESNSNWKIGDDTNGYLYSSSKTNLAVSTDNSTEFVLAKGNDGTFQFSYTNGDTKRYLCCRTDLTTDKANLFRLSSSDGVNKLTLYRYTEGSIANTNFCTTVPISVTISAAGWASFSSPNILDFSNVEGLTAYKATETSSSSVHYEEVTTVPANTGLILNGAAGTYNVPVAASASEITDNLLVGTADAAYTTVPADADLVYAFGKLNNKIGFVKAETGYIVPQGKAYLRLTPALAAKGLSFIGLPGDDGETTNINTLDSRLSTLDQNAPRYNLSGQRVSDSYKGIVIVNGKKYINK